MLRVSLLDQAIAVTFAPNVPLKQDINYFVIIQVVVNLKGTCGRNDFVVRVREEFIVDYVKVV